MSEQETYFCTVELNARFRRARVIVNLVNHSNHTESMCAELTCNLLDRERKVFASFDNEKVSADDRAKFVEQFTYETILDYVIQHSGGEALEYSHKEHHVFSADLHEM